MSYQQQPGSGSEIPKEAQEAGADAAREAQGGAQQMSREAQGGAQMAYQTSAGAATETGAMAASEPSVGGMTLGLVTFAGVMMIMGGIFHFFAGLGATINPDLYQLSRAYAFDMSVDTWGWLHIFAAIVMVLAGFYVFTGNLLARMIGIVVALASAVVNFAYIPYYPVWSLMIIAIDIGVIWALATYSHKDATSLTEGY